MNKLTEVFIQFTAFLKHNQKRGAMVLVFCSATTHQYTGTPFSLCELQIKVPSYQFICVFIFSVILA